MRVAIAEDEAFYRELLVGFLVQAWFEVTAAVPTGVELVRAVRRDPPDAVILDIAMPPTRTDEGIRTASQLRSEYPGLGIIVLSSHAEVSYADELAEKVGTGYGYFLKARVASVDAMLDGLRRVRDGGTAIDSPIAELLQKRRQIEKRRAKSPFSTLTARELQVIELMALGRTDAAISATLKISTKTVANNAASIRRKLGISASDVENSRIRVEQAYRAYLQEGQ